MDSKIVQLRRIKLKAWIDTHGAPAVEKSFFSQLVNTSCSFGEKAARRLEETYKMGHLYLDTPVEESASENDTSSTNDQDKSSAGEISRVRDPAQLQWVSAEERDLLSLYRATDDEGRETILDVAGDVPKVLFVEIAHYKQ